jgi:hypothetical protein
VPSRNELYAGMEHKPQRNAFASDRSAVVNGLAASLGSIPGLGDIAGLAADADMYASDPSSRRMRNYLLTGLGVLPFVPALASMGRATRNVPMPSNQKGIIRPDVVMGLGYSGKLPDHPDFAAAVANTPGAQVTPDGLLMKVARRQAAEVEGQQAIRTGVFYLPEGDPRMKHYGGKGGYGGTEKYSGDTLLKNPLFVKGATGGKAPEAAYDQLVGKGAYEAMRRDVLNVLNAFAWGGNRASKIEAIKSALQKYGGDPNMAHELVEASRAGNTLPYAIQEHIVAHAVRKAGYDGVLGYSKGKTGPFLSELFDVREQTYPSNVIEPQIHDAYNP